MRYGREEVVDSDEIVVGDIVIAKPGESIAADGVIINRRVNDNWRIGVMNAKYVTGNQSSSASLSDYVKQEINALEGNTYFELNESTPAKLGGNNVAHTLVYTASISDSYTLTVDREKTMETIATKNGTAYFVVYRENTNLYPTYLPLVNKMVDSFEFK
jgi:hypothetical protein